MHVLMSGSSGLVGSALLSSLAGSGHTISRLLRPSSVAAAGDDSKNIIWDPAAGTVDHDALSALECDAVVHLAGAGIADGRWSEKRKTVIRESRVNGTRYLATSLARLDRPPRVLVCASAIGFYGDRADEELDEESAPGNNFLADVCRQWEQAAQPARDKGIRVVHLRLGMILSTTGGALKKMLLPFRMGLGGIVAGGKQYWSWIDLTDAVGSIEYLLVTESLSGPVNGVAPDAPTNAEFTKALGRVLKRPTIFPMPSLVAKLMLGEMAQELLLASARVVPKKLTMSGYQFRYPTLEESLRHQLGRQ